MTRAVISLKQMMRNQEAGCGAFHSTFNAPRNHPRPISARNRDSGAKCPCALRRLGQEAAAPCSGHVCAAARTNPWRVKDTHNRSAAAVRVPARQGYARRGTRCRHFVRHRLTRSTTAEKKKKLFQKNSPRNICLPCECLSICICYVLLTYSAPRCPHISHLVRLSPLSSPKPLQPRPGVHLRVDPRDRRNLRELRHEVVTVGILLKLRGDRRGDGPRARRR